MTATVAVLSDLHLDRPFKWAGAAVGRKLRMSLRSSFASAVEAAGNRQVDAFLLPGDIYEHEHYAPDTAAFLRDQLAALHPIPAVVAAGNHDHLAPQSIWAQTDWSPNVNVFEINRWQSFELEPGLTLWGISHGRPSGTPNLLPQLQAGGEGIHLALFHGALRSAAPNLDTNGAHAPFDEADIRDAGIDHAFVGHYHMPRHAELLTYAGNPAPLEFGETGERGLVFAEIDQAGQVTTTCERVAHHDMHDLDLDVTGANSSHDIMERLQAELSGLTGVLRVTLNGELAPDIDLRPADLELANASILATVVRRGDLCVGYDFPRLADEPTVRGRFVSDVLAATDLDEETREAVLVTGLRALDGRSDLDVI